MKGALERAVAATAAGRTDTALGLLARSRALVSTGAEAEQLLVVLVAEMVLTHWGEKYRVTMLHPRRRRVPRRGAGTGGASERRSEA